MAKEMGNNPCTSIQENTPKSKNNPSKQKTHDAKRNMSKMLENNEQRK